jgi:hypothetical protein
MCALYCTKNGSLLEHDLVSGEFIVARSDAAPCHLHNKTDPSSRGRFIDPEKPEPGIEVFDALGLEKPVEDRIEHKTGHVGIYPFTKFTPQSGILDEGPKKVMAVFPDRHQKFIAVGNPGLEQYPQIEPVEKRMLVDEPNSGLHGLFKSEEKVLVCCGFPDAAQKVFYLFEGYVEDEKEQPLFVTKILEDGSLGDSQPANDSVDAGPLEAILAELLGGDSNDSVLLVDREVGEGL